MEVRDQTIHGFYEVISSYVTDTLFNHLYNTARQSPKSLFDAYIDCVNAYVITIKSDKKYYDVISSQIYKYFTHCTTYKNIGFSEFIDLIVKASIPNDYYSKLSKDNRIELCSQVICDCITNMATYVVNIEIASVIVSKNNRMRQAKALTDDIKKMGVDVLFSKRSELFNKFYQKKHQARDACIDSANMAAIKTQLREAVKKKIAAELIAHGYATRINELVKDNNKLKDKYKNKIELLTNENEKLKAKIKKKSKYDVVVKQEDEDALSEKDGSELDKDGLELDKDDSELEEDGSELEEDGSELEEDDSELEEDDSESEENDSDSDTVGSD